MSAQYKRPPITECVVELRFDRPISHDIISNIVKKYPKFPFSEAIQESNVEINVEINAKAGAAKVQHTLSGFKLSSVDRTEILMIKPFAISFVKLAPYEGWDSFFSELQSIWAVFEKFQQSKRKISRIGVRYINRIDIPVDGQSGISLERYFYLVPQLPQTHIANVLRFTSQTQIALGYEDMQATVNFASVPSPLINHISILLDLDLFREENIPQNSGNLWAFLGLLRNEKNRLFEASITDATRGLFNK